jgi:hypothetical protein
MFVQSTDQKQGQALLTICDLWYALEPVLTFLANLDQGTTSGRLGNFSHVLLVRHRLYRKGSLGSHNITPPHLVDCVKFTDLYMASYYG